MDLANAAAKYLATGPNTVSLLSARGASRLYDVVQSETRTEPMLATLFWQIFSASPAYIRLVADAGVSPLAALEADAVVVSHGQPHSRYDLLVLDPSASSSEPRAVTAHPNRSDLIKGWEVWRNHRLAVPPSLSMAPGSRWSRLERIVDSVDPDLAVAVSELTDFRILVLPPPRIDATASSLPSPAWPVTSAAGGQATAGVVATNRQGRVGVTAALHALGHPLVKVLPGATQAIVNGAPGVVDSIDQLSDSAFIALGPNSAATVLPGPVTSVAGPLSGLSPREKDAATFHTIAGTRQVFVTGWDKDVPFVRPFSQLRVYTTPGTSPGDSGAALLDRDNYVLGFAFYRTGLGEPIEYSAWVWADSVYQAHGLQ